MAIEYAGFATPKHTDTRWKFWAIFSAFLLFTFLFAVLVWPTRYRFETVGGKLIRIDRITGTVDQYSASTWNRWYPDPPGFQG